MHITDIIALAKAGYTAKDIKELLSVEVMEKSETITEPEKPIETESEEKEPDYKTLYENATKEIEKLNAEKTETENDLKKAQKVNSNANIANVENIESPEKIWENFLKAR